MTDPRFPVLTQKQINTLKEFGTIISFEKETALFEFGDEKGFIYTDPDVMDAAMVKCSIFEQRKPQSLEASIPGFFAVGDVRKGSVKRVASAVGEGSMAVSQIHQYLTELKMNN